MEQITLKRIRSILSYSFVGGLFVFSQSSIASIQNAAEIKNNSVENLVTEVVHNAEKSLPLVDSDTTAALQHVEEALKLVNSIKENISRDTHAEAKSPLVHEESKEYWYLYPRVDKKILSNKADFPMLHSKYSSGVLYKGESDKKTQNDSYAYFDYAFAYASLLTAKDALQANELLRAKIALKWVFEAVYITPEFLISKHDQQLQDNELQIDGIINIKGDYPIYSSLRNASNAPG